MKILFFCTQWGQEARPFADFATNVKAAGFDGVEMGLPDVPDTRKEILGILRAEGLKFIGQHWQTHDADFHIHKKTYERHLRILTEAKPLMITSQTGKDFFSYEQNAELIALAQSVAAETGVTILHETHRGRFSFAAHVTRKFLETVPHLRLALDISHWCAVAESLLDDQPDAVNLALSRTQHIHARVGFAEGPQIPDPQAPEWQTVVNRHLEWWDTAIDHCRQQQQEFFTITPEFGPPPYMTCQPYTQAPIANQQQINLFMKNLLAERYNIP